MHSVSRVSSALISSEPSPPGESLIRLTFSMIQALACFMGFGVPPTVLINSSRVARSSSTWLRNSARKLRCELVENFSTALRATSQAPVAPARWSLR